MVDEAVGPEENVGTAWDRAFVTPATGSDLELGQGFLEGFLFVDHAPESEVVLWPAWEFVLEDTVEVDEDDPWEEEEFDL